MAKEKGFEEYIAELADTVHQLESKENTLQDSLKLFEKGITLTKKCQAFLDKAEQKVTVLLQDASGDKTEQPFLPEEEA